VSILEEREAGSDRDASLDPHQESALLRAANRIREANTLKVTALAFIVGLAFGGLLIILTTPTLLRSWGGLFSHPGGTIALNAKTIWGDYELLFCGGVFDPRAVWAAIQHSNNAN